MKNILHYPALLKKLVAFALVLAACFKANAQSWTSAVPFGTASGGELGRGNCTDASGNVYYIGNYAGTIDFNPGGGVNNLTALGAVDIFITKYNSSGVFQWAVSCGSTSTDAGNAIATDGTNLYITGAFVASGTFGSTTLTAIGGSGTDLFVAKLSISTGAFSWAVNFGASAFGGDNGQAICLDGSGNPYIAGVYGGSATFGSTTLNSTGGSAGDMFVAKLNPGTGAVTWATGGGASASGDNGGGAGICYMPSLAEIIVVGSYSTNSATYGSTTLMNSGGNDIYVAELNASTGAFISAVKAGTANNDEALGIVYDTNTQDVILTGYYNGASITFGSNAALTNAGSDDIFVARYAPATNSFVWSVGTGGTLADRGNAICSNGLGGIYVTGQFRSSSISFGATSFTAASAFADIFVAGQNALTGAFSWALQGSGTNASFDDIARAISAGGTAGKIALNGQFASTCTFGSTALNSAGNVDIFLAVLTPPLAAAITTQTNITDCSTGCSGSATVTATGGTGSYTYSWSPNGGSGATATGLCANTYTVTVTDALSATIMKSATITMPATQLATATTSNLTFSVNATNNTIYDNSCNLIVTLVPNGGSPVSGTINASVWKEGSVPHVNAQPFVARHYEITPSTGASTATGRVTLYFTQAEFDAFNADAGSTLNLPTGTGDATGKANLRIGKYPGTSSNSSGLPGTYTGTRSVLDPVDADITWNAGASRWEVSFDVTGFSGFVVQTATTVLPLTWLSIKGTFNAALNPVISWQVQEQQVAYYSIQKSLNGIDFVNIGTVSSAGNGTNEYQFEDIHPVAHNAYYRIQQTDQDGQFTYSNTILLKNNRHDLVTAYPNPSGNYVILTIADRELMNTMASLVDIRGKELQRIIIKQTATTISLVMYAKGIYILKLQNGQNIKLLKE